jgi:hypothetical protein
MGNLEVETIVEIAVYMEVEKRQRKSGVVEKVPITFTHNRTLGVLLLLPRQLVLALHMAYPIFFVRCIGT